MAANSYNELAAIAVKCQEHLILCIQQAHF